MYRLSVVIIFFTGLIHGADAVAQHNPASENYFLNPFAVNPAEVATTHAQFYVNHRQQWMGFNGAPKTTTATFSTIIDDTRAAVGFKAINASRGIVRSTELSMTYGYAVPVDLNNVFVLGLSGGFVSHKIDLTNVDTSDPAIANYLSGNLQPSANFGILYKCDNGINVGFTIPQLFTPKFNNTAHLENRTLSTPGNEIVMSAYYKKKVEPKFPNQRSKRGKKFRKHEQFAPLEIYTLYRYSRDWGSQAEGIVKLNLSEACWVAGGYRQRYGVIGSLGFSITDKLTVSYAYEPGQNMQTSFAPDSHEVQIGLQLGKPRKFRRPTPVLQSLYKGKLQEEHKARFHQPTDEIAQNEVAEPTKHFYVVVKVFTDFNAADEFKSKLISQKFRAEVLYSGKDKKFYVHVFNSPNAAKAHQEARNLKKFTKLKEARVLAVSQDEK